MSTGGAESDVMHARTLLEDRDDETGAPDALPGASGAATQSWPTRYNTALTVVAALVCPVLYFVYLNHYAINVLQGDDWNMVPLGVHQALHGHTSLSLLWSQYGESRIILVKSVIILFAFFNQFDTRTVIFFDALAYSPRPTGSCWPSVVAISEDASLLFRSSSSDWSGSAWPMSRARCGSS